MNKKSFGLFLILLLFLVVIEAGLEIEINAVGAIIQSIILCVGSDLYVKN